MTEVDGGDSDNESNEQKNNTTNMEQFKCERYAIQSEETEVKLKRK